VSKLKLPWGEELQIESDVEQFSLDVSNLVAEYYIDRPDPTLVVVRSEDFILEGEDTFVVRSCKVTLSDAWIEDEEFDDERIEEVWKNFVLFDENAPPKEG